LYIAKLYVNEGPTLKRWMPRAFGRATTLRQRSSHVHIVLDDRQDVPAAKPAEEATPVQKEAKPIQSTKKPAVNGQPTAKKTTSVTA